MTRVLALDPSLTSTGYAYMAQGVLYTGCLPTGKMQASERIDYILRAVARLVDESKPELIAYEGYAMGVRGGGRLFDIGELGGVLKHYFWRNGIEVLLVPPSSMKMFVTGKGTADKVAVANALADEIGCVFSSADESDAVGLLMVGEAFTDGLYLEHGLAERRRKALTGCQKVSPMRSRSRGIRACVG